MRFCKFQDLFICMLIELKYLKFRLEYFKKLSIQKEKKKVFKFVLMNKNIIKYHKSMKSTLHERDLS